MTLKLTCLILVLLYKEAKCVCRHSFVTFCDDLEDLQDSDDSTVETWTDLVIGNENSDNSKLRAVDFDSFSLDRFEKLTSLTVVGQVNDIKTRTFSLDSEDTKVDYLNFYGNTIRRIRYDTFDAMILKKLKFANNSIEYIHKGAFYNCQIQIIDLSHNKLEMIESGVFTDEFLIENQTKEIVFAHNKIEFIEPLSLPSSLEVLNLDHNNIDFTAYGIFDNLVDLQVLTMRHNKMRSFPDIKNVTQIRVVDVSHNFIEYIHTTDFDKLSQLEILELSHNRIAEPVVFRHFNFPQRHPSLQISLAFNRLTHLIIEGDSFRNHIVSFYGNPWNCKCWDCLEKFMVENQVKRNECDLKFFGNGQIPYCIYYDSGSCAGERVKPSNKSENIDGFLESIKRTESIVGCRLSLRTL